MAGRSGSSPPKCERPALAGTGTLDTSNSNGPRNTHHRLQAQGVAGAALRWLVPGTPR